MKSWYSIFPRNPWLSIYVWIIFCLLPFFFIFRSSSWLEIVVGVTLLLLFFLSYRFSFKSKSGLVYMWLSFEMIINILMTLLFGFVYFSMFTAFFIGNIRHTAGFFIMYGLHIATTIGAILFGFFIEMELFLPQVHFLIITVIGTVLLPFNLYYRNKREKLEGQLEVARERISELIVFEERQRIARDLHDTLGQKLSLIGLKSDLAGKLVRRDVEAVEQEIYDIRQTASTALKELRDLVSNMRATTIEEELIRIRQILQAARIELMVEGDAHFQNIPPLIENVLSMCVKEAVTNVVKHSNTTTCRLIFKQSLDEIIARVEDDGLGFPEGEEPSGNGLNGIRERLEFVNGSLMISSGGGGTTLNIRIPIVIKESEEIGK